MIQTVLNSIPTPSFEYALLSPILIMFFAACLGVLVEAFVSIEKRRFAHLIIVFTSFFLFERNIYIGNALLIAFVSGVAYFEKNELMKLLKR